MSKMLSEIILHSKIEVEFLVEKLFVDTKKKKFAHILVKRIYSSLRSESKI